MNASMRKRIYSAEDKLIAKLDANKLAKPSIADERQQTAVSFVGEKSALVYHL